MEESEYQFKPPTRHHRGKVVAVKWPALAPIAPDEQLILGMYMYKYIHVLSNTYCVPDNTYCVPDNMYMYMYMCTYMYIESLCKQVVVIYTCVYLHYMYVHVFTYILIQLSASYVQVCTHYTCV